MTEWQWVERAAVLAAHDQLLAVYGGSEGVSLDGLEGALGRPHTWSPTACLNLISQT